MSGLEAKHERRRVGKRCSYLSLDTAATRHHRYNFLTVVSVGLHWRSSTDATCPTNGTGSVAHPASAAWVTYTQFPQSPVTNRPSSVGDQSIAKPSCKRARDAREGGETERMQRKVAHKKKIVGWRRKGGLWGARPVPRIRTSSDKVKEWLQVPCGSDLRQYRSWHTPGNQCRMHPKFVEKICAPSPP